MQKLTFFIQVIVQTITQSFRVQKEKGLNNEQNQKLKDLSYDPTKPLILTDQIESKNQEQAKKDSKITLKDVFLGQSGFFKVKSKSGKSQNNIFTLYQPPKYPFNSKKDSKVMLWMQGGPGGAGTFGSFSEIGRWYINEKIQPKENYHSWCKEVHCIFVDQPVMTGFSFQTDLDGNVREEKDIEQTATSPEATEQIWELLQQLMEIQDLHGHDFYISGESQGGQQTGSMGMSIIKNNSTVSKDKQIQFKGILLGDPVLNSEQQMLTQADTLQGMGLIMQQEQKEIEVIMQKAVAKIKAGKCPEAFNYWNSVWNDNGGGGAPGLFFKMTGCSATMFQAVCDPNPSFDQLTNFLKKPEVMTAMHQAGIKSASYDEGGAVYQTMVDSGDFCYDSSKYQATLWHQHGIELTIYSSNMDPLLGPPTTEAGINSMFDHVAEMPDGLKLADQWSSTKKNIWTTIAKQGVAGYSKCITKSEGNRFCQVVVRNAGHMTPSYAPRSSQDLFKRQITKDEFEGLPKKFKVNDMPECSGTNPFAGPTVNQCQ